MIVQPRRCRGDDPRALAPGTLLAGLLGLRIDRMPQDVRRRAEPRKGPPEKLSQYGLFLGNGSTQEPAEGVIPYELNSALFTDYAEKFRFVKLPGGTHADVQRRRRLRLPRRAP